MPAGPTIPKYSDTWFSQLKTGCDDDDTKIELVESLRYWVDRKNSLPWHRFAQLKECEKNIREYGAWIEEQGIKPKVLPPIPPSGNTSVKPIQATYEEPYGEVNYDKERFGTHQVVLLDKEKLEAAHERELQLYITRRKMEMYSTYYGTASPYMPEKKTGGTVSMW